MTGGTGGIGATGGDFMPPDKRRLAAVIPRSKSAPGVLAVVAAALPDAPRAGWRRE
ncbi:hypothetical protein [Paraburkholderia ginsengiterrae]|uniref:hypothetical protein n=1 Tax=Paraburkholderia ginsengiterrae TaxID=1462993 RepID=UPI000ACBFAB3|nr:hypothetical protein [Paraburkholderia ginsengiterrae]